MLFPNLWILPTFTSRLLNKIERKDRAGASARIVYIDF